MEASAAGAEWGTGEDGRWGSARERTWRKMVGINRFLGCSGGWVESGLSAGRSFAIKPVGSGVMPGTRAGELSSEKCLILDAFKIEPKGSVLDWMWCEGEVGNDREVFS